MPFTLVLTNKPCEVQILRNTQDFPTSEALIISIQFICTYEGLNRKRIIRRRVLFGSGIILCMVGILILSWCILSRPVEAPEVKKYAKTYEPKPQTSIKKEITPEIKEKASFQVLD